MHGRNHSDTRASRGHVPNHLGASDEQTEARACHCPCPAACSRLTQLNSPSGHASRSTLLTPFAANRENGQYMPAHKRQMDLHNLPPAQRSEHLSLSLSPSLSLSLPLSLSVSFFLPHSLCRLCLSDRSMHLHTACVTQTDDRRHALDAATATTAWQGHGCGRPRMRRRNQGKSRRQRYRETERKRDRQR